MPKKKQLFEFIKILFKFFTPCTLYPVKAFPMPPVKTKIKRLSVVWGKRESNCQRMREQQHRARELLPLGQPKANKCV